LKTSEPTLKRLMALSVAYFLWTGLDEPGFEGWQTKENSSSFSKCSDWPSGAHTVSYSMDIGGSFVRVKRPGSGVDHSPLSTAGIRDECGNTSIVPLSPRGGHWDNLAFTFYHIISRFNTHNKNSAISKVSKLVCWEH
jgi:hypothetical protein